MSAALRSLSLVLMLALSWAVQAAETRGSPVPGTTAVTPRIGSITPNPNAAALAQAIAGPGVTISNATYRGAANAAGFFAAAQSSIGINNGVVLSTGEVGAVIGPNDQADSSWDHGLPGDAALDLLVAPYTTHDAAVLEFDLTTTQTTIGIRYVFGSEEYNEFVGSDFNDVLGIFVNGVNCANANGRPVSVNSINSGSNPELYIDNATGTRNTQLDGLTVPLECVAAVTPGVPNHVRIVIADTSDGIWDAAVVLADSGVRAPGTGALTNSNIVRVIEYFHAGFGHYFVTAIPAEIAALDTGVLSKDWARTGLAFDVYVSGYPGSAAVCRFFSASFAPKSSHFYTPFADECTTVKNNPAWTFEAEVFNVVLPAFSGACPPGTRELFRLYNDGMSGAPNHRYVTDPALWAEMLANGWIAEGAGIGIIACIPI